MVDVGVEQTVYRNNPVMVGLVFILGGISLFLALCMGILVLATLFPLHGFTFQRFTSLFWWAMGTLVFGGMGPGLWQIGFQLAFAQARMDPRGVAFRLGTRRKPVERFFPWAQTAAVWHKRVGNAQYYGLQGVDGQTVQFSSYTFLRPRKLARTLAARAGRPLQEL